MIEVADQSKPTNLGNIWMIAATVARTLIDDEPGAPALLLMNVDGVLEAVGPRNPDYEKRLLSTDLVCSVSNSMPVERLAARLRDAALRSGRVT